MKNISINGLNRGRSLERSIKLNNGTIVLASKSNRIVNAYMVVSFRDHKNDYPGDKTRNYCTLLDLDTGNFVFSERCSRNTTVKRVLNHLLHLGPGNHSTDEYGDYDLCVRSEGEYALDISL